MTIEKRKKSSGFDGEEEGKCIMQERVPVLIQDRWEGMVFKVYIRP